MVCCPKATGGYISGNVPAIFCCCPKGRPMVDNEKAKETLIELKRECGSMIHRLLTSGLTVERSADEIDQLLSHDARDNAAIEIQKYRDKEMLIDRCLRHVETSGYGVCKQCEQKITPKRIAAVPWAIYCIRCEDFPHEEEDPEPGILTKPSVNGVGQTPKARTPHKAEGVAQTAPSRAGRSGGGSLFDRTPLRGQHFVGISYPSDTNSVGLPGSKPAR